MLAQYRIDVRNLLQNPAAPVPLYDQASVDRWINIARGQLAGEGECIRVIGTIDTVIGQRAYDFSDISLGVVADTGIRGAINVRRINYVVGDGQQFVTPRAWEWFDFYNLNDPAPVPGPPTEWSQFGQGSAGTSTGSGSTGSFYLDPPPDFVYSLRCDCVCYPVALIDDTTAEAIPYLWTDAVPFFAAYYAYLSSQTSARQADALRMMSLYTEFMKRARTASNPSVLRNQYEQSSDISQAAKFGIKPGVAGAQQ